MQHLREQRIFLQSYTQQLGLYLIGEIVYQTVYRENDTWKIFYNLL